MKILDFIKDNIFILDGAMGTRLQSMGLKPGELPERWNISHPECIIQIHREYFDAGSNIVFTNTFGANSLKFSDDELALICKSAIENAREASRQSSSDSEKFVAFDMGPSGKMLKPYGDFEFEEAVALFSKTVALAQKYGADLIFIETMNDSYETKAALLGAKEASDLPVFVTCAYGEDEKLLTGASPEAMVAMLEGLGADAIGANCSVGPDKLVNVAKRMLACASVPVIMKPNAGIPVDKDGETIYDITPEIFTNEVKSMVLAGVRGIGGCCGTSPAYIRMLRESVKGLTPVPIEKKTATVVSSYTHTVEFGELPLVIGERINPTGKKRLKEAIRNGDIGYILQEALGQEERGAHILDVNVGLPGTDESANLEMAVREIQAVTALPLQIDTSDITAMEKALRCVNGKPMINSVNGKRANMEAVFPLAKKYGGVVVCLTLDEGGIPDTWQGRVEIAKKILKTAAEYGIDKKDLVFDTLAMAVSADPTAAKTALRALHEIRYNLGCHTVLGVSNISFGLPDRDSITSSFFTSAFEVGLSSAIMNPYSVHCMRAYRSFLAVHGLDDGFSEYLKFTAENPNNAPATSTPVAGNTPAQEDAGGRTTLMNAVIKGLKGEAATETKALLETCDGNTIIQQHVIPALDIVGKGFEEKTVYLPSLLMSAEAAKSSFEVVKAASTKTTSEEKFKIVIATVKGDIHDIGKNIVKLLLENYGYNVIDLGKDVDCELIVETAIENQVPLVGLSALMTTTVPAMEETIRLLHERYPECKICVGGAVLTKDYAEKIGADKYCSDAMETVRYAEELNKLLRS